MSNKQLIQEQLVSMGFPGSYVQRAFKVYEKNYGHNYNMEVIVEIIVRLQEKDAKKGSKKTNVKQQHSQSNKKQNRPKSRPNKSPRQIEGNRTRSNTREHSQSNKKYNRVKSPTKSPRRSKPRSMTISANSHQNNTNILRPKIDITPHKKRKTKEKWKRKAIETWSNSDVLHWMESFGIVLSPSYGDIIDEISSTGCNGEDVASLQSEEEVGDAFNISNDEALCRNIFNEIFNLRTQETDIENIEKRSRARCPSEPLTKPKPKYIKNRKGRSMTASAHPSEHENNNVMKVYKMYYESKGKKASTAMQLVTFGQSVGIVIDYIKANKLIKNDANYLDSLVNDDVSPIKCKAKNRKRRISYIEGDKNEWRGKLADEWDNNDVLHWIDSLCIKSPWHNQLIYMIKDTGCNGADVVSLQSVEDVRVSFNILNNEILCKDIFNKIKHLEISVEEEKVTEEKKGFNINIFSQNKNITLNTKATKRTKVRYIKKLYKVQSGVHAKVDDIHLYSHSKLLKPSKTLGDVGIVDEKHLITIKFGADGASV